MKIFLAVVLWAIVEVSYSAAQRNDSKCCKEQATTQTDQRGTESNPIIIKTLQSPKDPAAAKKEEEEREKCLRKTEAKN